MKKLLFICTLAAICTFATSSLKSTYSSGAMVLQTSTVEPVKESVLQGEGNEEKLRPTRFSEGCCCPISAKTQTCYPEHEPRCYTFGNPTLP